MNHLGTTIVTLVARRPAAAVHSVGEVALDLDRFVHQLHSIAVFGAVVVGLAAAQAVPVLHAAVGVCVPAVLVSAAVCREHSNNRSFARFCSGKEVGFVRLW